MTTAPALRPCPVPWCGYADPSFVFGPNEPDTYQIECEECGCTTPEYPTETAAIAAWNTRPDDGVREALAQSNFTILEPYLESYRVIIGFSNMAKAQAMVSALRTQGEKP